MTGFALFDTHTHLNDSHFDTDREEVLDHCITQGITQLIEIADSPIEWTKAIDLCRFHPDMIRCALGLHPYYADQWTEDMERTLFQQVKLPEVVAIGEIGLDYAKCTIPKEVQRESFLKMLATADQCELPVIIHCREAYPDMMAILREKYGPRQPERFHGVIHCFSGSTQDAVMAVRLGFALGVDGPITYPKNKELRQAILTAGLDDIVLETDSPYLPPQSHRGERNDPTLLSEIVDALTLLFQAPPEQVAETTRRNGVELFRLDQAVSPEK